MRPEVMKAVQKLKILNELQNLESRILFGLPLRSLSSTFSHKAVNFLSTPVSTGVFNSL
jgi:hypothetical protein